MSSFYGPGGAGGGGSSATDYNNLSNIPIKNIAGSSEYNFYNLMGLDYGNYSLTGYYKTSTTSDLFYTQNPISVSVVKDSETGDKVISYFEIKNGQLLLHVITYHEDGQVEEATKSVSEPEVYPVWESFEEE